MSRPALVLGRRTTVARTAAADAAPSAPAAAISARLCVRRLWLQCPAASTAPAPKRTPERRHASGAHRWVSSGAARQDDQPRPRTEEEIEEAARTCWRCGGSSPPEKTLCPDPKCKAALPLVKGLSYFDMLLGPGKIGFDIDLQKLRANFLNIQQGVHPDAHSQKSQKEHAFAEQQSAFANKGYRILKDPVQRGMYLLELYGKAVAEDVSLAENDFELLSEVMDYRERIDEAGDLATLEPIRKDVQEKFERTLRAVSDAFRANDLDQARQQVVRLSYYRNIERVAEDKTFQFVG